MSIPQAAVHVHKRHIGSATYDTESGILRPMQICHQAFLKRMGEKPNTVCAQDGKIVTNY
ncbi:MAG: hypothetical protein LBD96_11265 [Treponema sp.]|jgi:hypothetical protein|nr:hypothetical protein [Treponema sp.]